MPIEVIFKHPKKQSIQGVRKVTVVANVVKRNPLDTGVKIVIQRKNKNRKIVVRGYNTHEIIIIIKHFGG